MARFKNGNLILENEKSVVSGSESVIPIRNLIINGDMNIWQRGTSWPGGVTGVPTYTADRWACERTGSGNNTVAATGTSPDNFRTSLQFSSTDSNAKNLYVWQRIEGDNFRPLIGETVYVGAWVGMNITNSAWISIYSNPGSRDTWADAENTNKTLVKSTSGFPVSADTWTYISTTFTVTDQCKNGVVIGIRFGQIEETAICYLTGVRVHKGDTKIPWNLLSRPGEEEIALCQRYYEAQGQTLDVGVAYTTANAYGPQCWFRVEKRVVPTMTNVSFQVYNSTGSWHNPATSSTFYPKIWGFAIAYVDATVTAWSGSLTWTEYEADAEL